MLRSLDQICISKFGSLGKLARPLDFSAGWFADKESPPDARFVYRAGFCLRQAGLRALHRAKGT